MLLMVVLLLLLVLVLLLVLLVLVLLLIRRLANMAWVHIHGHSVGVDLDRHGADVSWLLHRRMQRRVHCAIVAGLLRPLLLLRSNLHRWTEDGRCVSSGRTEHCLVHSGRRGGTGYGVAVHRIYQIRLLRVVVGHRHWLVVVHGHDYLLLVLVLLLMVLVLMLVLLLVLMLLLLQEL